MRLTALRSGEIIDVSFSATSDGALAEVTVGGPVELRPGGEDVVVLQSGGHRTSVRGAVPADTRRLEQFAASGPRMAAVVAHDGTRGVLRIWAFGRRFALGDRSVTIHLERQVLESVAASSGAAMGHDDLMTWFADEFILGSPDGSTRAVLRAEKSASFLDRGFVLLGESRELDVRSVGRGLEAVRLAPARQESVLSTVLLDAQIRFTTDVVSDHEDEPHLAALLGDDSYLRQWARYGESEYETEAELAASIGTADYVDVEPMPDGTWRFLLGGPSELLAKVESGTPLQVQADGPAQNRDHRRFTGGVETVRRSVRAVDLRPLDPTLVPAKVGTLEYAIGGSTTSHRRRVEAARRLATGAVPMPELAAILEMKSSTPRRVDRRLTWDSPATRQIFGGSEPTDAQKHAIEIALNTPDVAIIQGPPGTGKTQVIAAIAARVAEAIGDKGATRQVLLTSFQHDAVDNVASRTVVFGLPTAKETSRREVGSWLRTWRQDRLRHANELYAQVEHGELNAKREWLFDRRSAYLLAPVPDESAADLLEDIAQELGDHLSTAVTEDLLSAAQSLRGVPRERDMNLLPAIRSLRSQLVAHRDDGRSNAARVLRRLERLPAGVHIELDALDVIQAADDPTEDQLAAVAHCRDALLDLFGRAQVRTAMPSRNATVLRALDAVLGDIEAAMQADGQGLATVLSRFVLDLETDARGVEQALGEYAAVVAATCQGSAALAARPEAVDDMATFDTVIVDEAARANPLDLQIPMSVASRRVVLVGDQRQLPHIVDDEIASEVVASAAERAALEESLFGRLFRFLQIERASGRPDRVVTLNKQFRMHPRLGDFVSANFYEPHGQRIESPRPADEFLHDLPGYEGRVASWLDVPAAKGREESAGKSRQRTVEAESVALEAQRLLEAAPRLSFGIITFYRAQSELILEHLFHLGVADRDPDTGVLAITSDRWRFTTDERGEIVERLRVGTVDAFQGKEFDVALLSTVRTPRTSAPSPNAAFGHLRIMNRLCVAMSRQRRLLIIVGDRHGLVDHPSAPTEIAPLPAFADLCDEASHE